MTLDSIFNSKTHSPYNPKLNPLTLKSTFLRSYPLTSVKVFYNYYKKRF
ncbi:hypothetical protein N409_04155 [Helicobacter pylori FD719]|nr:hypothetical protein N409_04155 [Helicobacter pylori FD719]